MNENLPIFKHIVIEKNKGTYKSFSNSSILITGDYLIVTTNEFSDENYLKLTHNEVIRLSEIKSYQTK